MGRPLKLTESGQRAFRNHVLQNCFDPLHVIVAIFNNYTYLNIGINAGHRYIKRLKTYSYVAIQKSFLSNKNICRRILVARTHENWTQSKWTQVLFTDEAAFFVRPKKNHLRVLRHSGKRLHLRHIVPEFKSGFQTVSVWGGFSMRRRTRLVGTIGKFDKYTYRNIVHNHVLAFMYDVHGGSDSFVLQEDNCGPHRAKSIAEYLTNEELVRMQWPAKIPDLNAIENIWGSVKGYLRKRDVHPKIH